MCAKHKEVGEREREREEGQGGGLPIAGHLFDPGLIFNMFQIN